MVNITTEIQLLDLRCYIIVVYTSYHLVNSSCVEGDVHLVGGGTVMEGRVEVCHNQIWWAVSGSSSYWDYRDATVVCRHLGYPADCKLCHKNTQVYQLLIPYICVGAYFLFQDICLFKNELLISCFPYRGNSNVHCILWERQCHHTGSKFWMYWKRAVTPAV